MICTISTANTYIYYHKGDINKMSQTLVTDFITVEGINTKVSEKLPEAFRATLDGSIKTSTGWLNVRKGVGIDKFEKGGTYSVELEISEKGNKTIIAILSLDDKGTGATTTAPVTAKAYTKVDKVGFEKRDNSMEAGGIMHDAVALAAAVGVTGLTVEEAVDLVEKFAGALLEVKRELQG